MGKEDNSVQTIEKAPDRLKVLERIEEYEKNGWWSKDVEDDPPTIPLTPDKVDYLNKKLINKILSKIITRKAEKFIDDLIASKKLIIKDVRGLENFTSLANQGTTRSPPMPNGTHAWAL